MSSSRLQDSDWLREQYVLLDRSQADIASEVGVGRATVSEAIRSAEVGTVRCPTCGDAYVSLGSHWKESCEPAPLTDYQHELLTGHLMSDASTRVRDDRACLRWMMTNKSYMEWLDQELGWLTNGFKLIRTAEESAAYTDGDPDKYNALYEARTVRHPELVKYHWRKGGQKRFPRIDLTPTVLKVWYCGDGGLGFASGSRYPGYAYISCANEEDRPEFLKSLFDPVPSVSPTVRGRGRICFTQSDTNAFLDWLGGAPPGFEYKWCNESKEKYDKMKP